jgi:periplasmic divalent cation tolerance protein
MADTDVCILLVTAPPDEAEALADTLVENRLVACANLLPGVQSIFWWQGKRDEAQETLVVFKTTRALAQRATDAVVAAHPYETPEVLVLPILGGHAPYLDWVRSEASA